jgi:hypothetical protein
MYAAFGGHAGNRSLNILDFLGGKPLADTGQCKAARGDNPFDLGFIRPHRLAQSWALAYHFPALGNELFKRQGVFERTAQRLKSGQLQSVRPVDLFTSPFPETPCLFTFNANPQRVGKS